MLSKFRDRKIKKLLLDLYYKEMHNAKYNLVYLQTNENVWLEKDEDKIRDRVEKLKKMSKPDMNKIRNLEVEIGKVKAIKSEARKLQKEMDGFKKIAEIIYEDLHS